MQIIIKIIIIIVKATKKEKEIIEELRVMIEKDTTTYNLRNAREQWLDKLRYEKLKLAKCEEKRRRKQDNIMFQLDQKGFFRSLEEEETHEGGMPEMEKFVEFWEGIWEREERTSNVPWMEEIRRQLNEKVNQVNEFNIIFEKGSGKEKRMDSTWNRWKVMESPGKNGSTIKFIMTGC